jgi:hypothetical protein
MSKSIFEVSDLAAVSSTTPATATPAARLVIEYWTVAMDGLSSCGSCDETRAVIADALDTIHPLAQPLGIAVELLPRVCESWAEAVDHAIVASPTIRAAGSEFRPSHPDNSEARVWQWRGRITPALTPEAALDFLVQAIAARSQQLGDYLASGGPAPYVRQFLQIAQTSEAPAPSGCC